MKKLLIAMMAGAALTACAAETDRAMDHSGHNMSKGIEISSVHIKPPFPGKDVAAGFFSITNHGADDRLIAASSPISGNVEIHTHLNDNGVMKMRQIDGVDLPSGETIEFRPGSYHLMMFGVELEADQVDAALKFTYENADPVTLIVPIGEPNDTKMDHRNH